MAKHLPVLVVDDDLNSAKPLFDRIFEVSGEMAPQYAESWSQLTQLRLERFAAILLDVNLDKWGRRLDEALELVSNRCPIVLVSRWWQDSGTHRHVSQALAASREVMLIGTIALETLDTKDWRVAAEGASRQLHFLIQRVRNFSVLDLGADDDVNILHLSDPQYGDPNTERISGAAEDEIARFVRHHLRMPIHIVAITGDITYSGQPSEFSLAAQRTERLLTKLFSEGVNWRNRVLLVPGNHDVNLRLGAASKIKIEFPRSGERAATISVAAADSGDAELRAFGLRCFQDFAYRITADPRYLLPRCECLVVEAFLPYGIRFVLVNTVSALHVESPRAFQVGENCRAALNDIQADSEVFTLAMAHHGPPFLGPVEEGLSDWAELLKAFQTAGIRVLLHGHGHERRTDVLDLTGSTDVRPAQGKVADSELLRVMAPTSHLNGRLRTGSRGFNVLTLGRRYGRVEKVVVEHYELDHDVPHRADVERAVAHF